MQKIRVIIEAEIDEENMEECGCDIDDVRNGIRIYDSDIIDGFEFTTSIRGCDNTSDFFLKNGEIKKVELLNSDVSKDDTVKDKENKND